MNRLMVTATLASLSLIGCVRSESLLDACRAELADVNLPGMEQIVFLREESGESGYAFVTRNCVYVLPLSISSIEVEERYNLGRKVLELIRADPDQRGVGLFEAQCDCDYDEEAGVIRANVITNVRRYEPVEADQNR